MDTALEWSVVRSLTVTSAALLLSGSVSRWVRSSPSGSARGRIALSLALLPLFVPDLLIGFTYRLTSARLVHSVVSTESLYAALLVFRILALHLAVRMILPESSVNATALHSWTLLPRRNSFWWLTWFRLMLAGPWRVPLVAWLAGLLFCFQEFETAALLQVDRHPVAWTVWLFDARALNERLSRLIAFALPALILQSLVLIPGLQLLRSGPALPTWSQRPSVAATTGDRSTGLLVVVASVWLLVIWPVISHGMSFLNEFGNLIGQGFLVRSLSQIATSLCEAAIAAAIAMGLCRTLWQVRSAPLTLVAVLPGLCGSLIISLALLALFQWSLLHSLYDTWMPMILGHTLLMLPRAFLLVAVLNVLVPKTVRHTTQMLQSANHVTAQHSANRLSWVLEERRWLIAFAVLTHWCFWDVTIASILRPVRFEPIVTRLYNEMHYGRTESLVALSALSLLLPWIAAATMCELCKRVLR
ncbi:MAG: hypothetical protein R3C59_01925 [Planctomycetaceae bacterium]